jgi:hypothetical protein
MFCPSARLCLSLPFCVSLLLRRCVGPPTLEMAKILLWPGNEENLPPVFPSAPQEPGECNILHGGLFPQYAWDLANFSAQLAQSDRGAGRGGGLANFQHC